jgi:integrase/recombinase XerD
MLNLFRKHLTACPHRAKGRAARRCPCPLWVDGSVDGREYRKSLGTGDWEEAQGKVRDLEASRLTYSPELRKIVPEVEAKAAAVSGASSSAASSAAGSIEAARKAFLAEGEKRKLRKSTLYPYKILFRQLEAFAAQRRLTLVRELDVRTLEDFRLTWKGESGLTDMRRLERLRRVFKFAMAHGYVKNNPATALAEPIVRQNPTLPFTAEEMLAILTAAEKRIVECWSRGRDRARRAKALVLFMRYTGLRISDAVGCACDRLQNGKLFLYTQKTGQHVYIPLPPFVVAELERVPRVSSRYWFWTGGSSVETRPKKWGKTLSDLFDAAEVKDGHAHRFRDTFAVELLKSGVPIERVSILLGHSSVKITEKHYNPWNRARQEQAEADVLRSWSSDPLVLLETNGVPVRS